MTYFSGVRLARRFTEFVYLPWPDGMAVYQPTKEAARHIADVVGIRTPALLARFATPLAIDLSAMPSRFVLKANNLAAKHGVYLLERRGTEFFNTFAGRTLGEDDIRNDLLDALRKRGKPIDSVIAEEFIDGENGPGQIPFDYKMYTFDGSVELIVQINRNADPPQVAFYGHGFVPLEPHLVRPGRNVVLGKHRQPANREALLAAAQRLSLHLRVPFVSVDTYTTGTEVILGELTPRPGGPYYGMFEFSDELDLELGTHYGLAFRRRGVPIPVVNGLPPVHRRRGEQSAPLAVVASGADSPTHLWANWADARRNQKAGNARTPGVKESARLLLNATRRWVRRRFLGQFSDSN